MVLFQLINGKDVFEAFYKKDLAKRLLLDRSASYDMERSMISKLKTECGNAFTSKLEGMFKDIDLSKDIMGSFRASQFNASRDLSKDVDLSVQVLTTGYWPAYPVLELNLPPIFVEAQKSFADHYLTKHQGRRLCWQHSLGHCIVRARFPKANKELQLSLFQSIVLMLFGDTDELGFKEIKDATALDDQVRPPPAIECAPLALFRPVIPYVDTHTMSSWYIHVYVFLHSRNFDERCNQWPAAKSECCESGLKARTFWTATALRFR